MRLFQLFYPTRPQFPSLFPHQPTQPSHVHMEEGVISVCFVQRKEDYVSVLQGLDYQSGRQLFLREVICRQKAAQLWVYTHMNQVSWKTTVSNKKFLFSWHMDIHHHNMGHSKKLSMYYKIHLAHNLWKHNWRIHFVKCYIGCWPVRSLIIQYVGKYGWSSWQPHKRSNTLTFFFSDITQIAWTWRHMDDSREEASWQSLMTIYLLRDYFHTKAEVPGTSEMLMSTQLSLYLRQF